MKERVCNVREHIMMARKLFKLAVRVWTCIFFKMYTSTSMYHKITNRPAACVSSHVVLMQEGGNVELLKGLVISVLRYLLKPHPVQTILSLQFVLSVMMMIAWKYIPFERVNKYKGKSFPSSRRTHQLHFDNNHEVDLSFRTHLNSAQSRHTGLPGPRKCTMLEHSSNKRDSGGQTWTVRIA